MNRFTRRDFVKTGMAGVASMSALASSPDAFAESQGQPSATDRIELGQTGIKCSRVAMGTGFHGSNRSSNQTRLGMEGFKKLMHHGFDQGINFYDMADLYGSHPYMREVLKEIDRDEVVLLSKIWYRDAGIIKATDTAKEPVERFRKELGVDMIDVVLIHCVIDRRWPEHRQQMMDELDEMKEKQIIRATGVSCHDYGALQVAAEAPWVDVIFARINPYQIAMDSTPENIAATLKKARDNGKAVVGMKIYGAGRATDAEERDKSLRFTWGNDLVDAMTIGFEKPAQVNDTVDHLTRVLRA